MKLLYILLLTLPLLCHSYPAAEAEEVEKSLSLEEVELLSDSDHAGSELADSQISKRSGSFDYVTHLKSGLLSSIGQASASIASGSSGGSSGGGGSYKSHDSGHHGNSVEHYDPWSFKKSVLNTIFQAVKAITGGVTALKGQLIKGSGYALSASGNLVAASGDKVTDVGKAIISSAQLNSHGYGHSGHGGGGGGSVHPFAKFSSLSGASSGSSSGGKHTAAPHPVVHTETITTYEIPSGHGSYGPPSKPPTFSSATHQYLPPAGGHGGYSSGGAPFSGGGGHVSFEAPSSNYLPSSSYGHDGHNDDFNIYGRHKKLTDDEARKAASQLQEILGLLPNGKTEFTASKTVILDTQSPTGHAGHSGSINPEHVELQTYGLPNDLGPLESLSHTESITAAYGARPQHQLQENPSDIYRQMAKQQHQQQPQQHQQQPQQHQQHQQQTPEEVYIQKHPNEGYDYQPSPTAVAQQPPPPADNHSDGYKYNNYHATSGSNNALQDLTPIIAALEVAKRRSPPNVPLQQQQVNTQYSVEKNVYKATPSSNWQQNAGSQGGSAKFQYLPPVVQQSKYTYFNPAQSKADEMIYPPPRPVYQSGYKVRRNAPPPNEPERHKRQRPAASPIFKTHDYEIQDPMLFNRMMSF